MSTVIVSKSNGTRALIIQRLKILFHDQLKQGRCPRDLALAFALGSTLGIMPLVWGTSLICIIIASWLRVNQVVMQLANYLMYPLQIILFIPYLILGEKLFTTSFLPENHLQLLDQIKQTPFLFFSHLWQSNLQGLIAWLVISPLVFILIFGISYFLVGRFSVSST